MFYSLLIWEQGMYNDNDGFNFYMQILIYFSSVDGLQCYKCQKPVLSDYFTECNSWDKFNPVETCTNTNQCLRSYNHITKITTLTCDYDNYCFEAGLVNECRTLDVLFEGSIYPVDLCCCYYDL